MVRYQLVTLINNNTVDAIDPHGGLLATHHQLEVQKTMQLPIVLYASHIGSVQDEDI